MAVHSVGSQRTVPVPDAAPEMVEERLQCCLKDPQLDTQDRLGIQRLRLEQLQVAVPNRVPLGVVDSNMAGLCSLARI